MSQEPKVVVEGLSKVFDTGKEELLVLEDIDLEVAAGEFVCFLGPSGCGKSTLLNIAGGFEPPTRGAVRIDGVPVTEPNSRRVFVFQEYGIFPWSSVWDNVALGLRDRPRAEQLQVVQEVIELVGLEGFERSYPRELSGGMKQRVEVARALAVDPDVLFMDEPFGALDSLTRLTMRAELIRIWRERRPTILFVTHDVDEALQLGERIVVFSSRPGRIADELDLSHLQHPRDISGGEYATLRRRLFAALGVEARV